MKSNMSTRKRYVGSSLVGISMLTLGLLGCSSNQAKRLSATLDTNLLQVVSALAPTQINPGTIVMVNGTYGSSCQYQGGGSSLGLWSLPANGYALGLDYSPLEVVTGNSACTLEITDVKMTFGSPVQEKYSAASAMAVTGSYLNNSIAFQDPLNPGSTIFYANVIQDAGGSSYSSNIHLTFSYSSDINLVPGTFNTTFAMVSAAVTTNQIPAPNYTYNPASSTLAITVDTNGVIQGISGSLRYDNGLPSSVVGDKYVVVFDVADPNNIGDVQAAFNANPQTIIPPGSFFTIDGATKLNFVPLSDSVNPAVNRYIIIRHPDPAEVASAQPTASYEIFKVTFAMPL